jgi:iron uptake system component EfeO
LSVARRSASAGALLVAIAALTGCGADENTAESGPRAAPPAESVAVYATDTACQVAKTDFTAGKQTFATTNAGAQPMELYVYGPGDRVVTELHNVDPGDTEHLTVQLAAGTYQIACKPGRKGEGIRQRITVSGVAAEPSDPRLAAAVTAYRAYVQGQVDSHLPKVLAFAAAVKAGDVATAKRLYAPSRIGWERIEPVAESFGDIDPNVDLREADLEPGQQWTGWHRLEKALWVKGSTAGQARYADRLVADIRTLQAKVPQAEITPTGMANGAKELLDEVATGKVTGEEEAFSHTDLLDIVANVDGAKKVHELLRPVVVERDPHLAGTIDAGFRDLQGLLHRYHRGGTDYVSYDKITPAQRRELSDTVNALEPVSRLAAVVAD